MKRIFLFILKLIKKLLPIVLFLAIILFIIKSFNKEISSIILGYIKILIWPLVIIYLTIIFKHNISKFIDELSELSFFGNKAKRELPTSQEVPKENIPEEIEETAETKKESLETSDKESRDILLELANYKTALHFERIYNIIFGSQINLLDRLKLLGGVGLVYIDIASFYESIRKDWSVLRNYSIHNYLGYLQNSGLIEPFNVGNVLYYKITQVGVDFLEYIESMKYLKQKNN